MPKLALVVCAATFFTLAMAGTLRTVRRSTSHLDINDAATTIRNCAGDLHETMRSLGPQPLNMHPEIVDEYEANITTTVQRTRTIVEEIMENVQPNSLASNCRKFLSDWETTGGDLIANSFSAMLIDFAELMHSVRGVHDLASKKQQQLQTADLNACAGSNCNTIGNDVDIKNVTEQFCSHAREVTDEYLAMLNGTRTRKMLFSSLEYRDFISEGRDVAERTRTCVSLFEASGQNEYVVSIV